MFLVAAKVLAGTTGAERLAQGALYPPIGELRAISRRIAIAVAREARDEGIARILSDEEIEREVNAMMWDPGYGPYWVEPKVNSTAAD